MPASRGSQTIHIGRTGDLETMNFTAANDPSPGEIGQAIYAANDRAYQKVNLDSGATSATSRGVVADGHLAYWKDKVNYLVTNDIAQAIGAEDATQDNKRNNVAGVFVEAVDAGNICLIQQRGNHPNVFSDGGGDFIVGEECIPGDTTNADIDRLAGGTAATHTVVGLVSAVESASRTAVDLQLPVVP